MWNTYWLGVESSYQGYEQTLGQDEKKLQTGRQRIVTILNENTRYENYGLK